MCDCADVPCNCDDVIEWPCRWGFEETCNGEYITFPYDVSSLGNSEGDETYPLPATPVDGTINGEGSGDVP